MSPAAEKNKKENKRKSLLLLLLYVATALFTSWLLVVLIFTFFFSHEQVKEQHFGDEKIVTTSSDIDEPILPVEPLHRDELVPPMKDLLKDIEFDQERFEELFENMKSLSDKEVSVSHSTFGRKVIYIYHSHSRESFLPYLKGTNKPGEAFHSKANITAVGELLGRALEKRGVGTKVDSTDIVQQLDVRGLDYASSYTLSGEQVRAARADNKDLEIFLDIHRDSLRRDSTTVEVNGKDYARLLFVVGTGHENYESNLLFAEGLNDLLMTKYPELSKGVLQKDSRQGNGVYNQDISPNAVIVEIGGVDNTLDELQRTTEALADVLSDYYFHTK
ncbi:stage II sporulation protein P [Sporosarcina sp. NPDC096371]|uniref:stage II sporulation protein P n=1 Tax=Sporosarcina sp. NPDC096371 TaxID=3364530 RepID=UPI00381BCBE0